MPWPLRYAPDQEGERPRTPGECSYMSSWDEPNYRAFWLANRASKQYLEQWADKRPPVLVRLPSAHGGSFPFSPDEAYTPADNSNVERNGWTVTGSIEDGSLTVAPSIHCVGAYHGFVNNGQVSDPL